MERLLDEIRRIDQSDGGAEKSVEDAIIEHIFIQRVAGQPRALVGKELKLLVTQVSSIWAY